MTEDPPATPVDDDATDVVEAYLPDVCYFSRYAAATPTAVLDEVVAAGFANAALAGTGPRVAIVTVIAPGAPPVRVSPAPQPAPKVPYDVASEIVLTLG